uniref:G protein-regulated inducer of neurite outgrowth C-terminal domain-containing protein n=1 Tax=Sphenodon punctatus TaxID=8508 RepID=A0A8D0GFR1_SPHPU
MEIASSVRTVSNLLPSDNVQSRDKSTNHFLTVDQSSSSWEGKDSRMHVKSSTTEDVSSVCSADEQITNQMEGLGAAVQRSHSDLTCSCKQPSPISHMETSATYSIMSSGSGYGSSVGSLTFQRHRYGSETYENAPSYESSTGQVPSSPKDQNVPTNSFDCGAVPRNTNIHADPATFQAAAAALGTHMPGNGFPNRTMYAHATGIIQGGLMYTNVSNSMYLPAGMTIHNSTAPCNARQESTLKMDGTIPAYCHSLPIPSIQLVPRLVCSVSESGREQVAHGYCQSLPTTEILTFPKLVSSVSESGLDAKRILKCCSAPGEQLLYSQPCVQQSRAQQEITPTYVVLNKQRCADITKTKDMWTMTSMNDLTRGLKTPLECKDAEVQTIPTMECKSVATSPFVAAEGHPHMFPEVNLEPEANLEPETEGEKSPVPEVRWDDEGMTWEVYGAAVDPEVLGLAIQKHLEIQIEQFQTDPLEESRENTEEPPPGKEEKKRSLRTMIHSLRHPSCCAGTSSAVE